MFSKRLESSLPEFGRAYIKTFGRIVRLLDVRLLSRFMNQVLHNLIVHSKTFPMFDHTLMGMTAHWYFS